MTKHPCAGLSDSARLVFEQIATGDALPSAHRRTLQMLEKRGLIQRLPDRELGRDRFGVVRVPQYEVPLNLHAQWCRWCSEQPGIEQEMDGAPAP